MEPPLAPKTTFPVPLGARVKSSLVPVVRSLVTPEMVSCPEVVIAPEKIVPAPEILPFEAILIVGEVRKLVKPEPNVRPLKVLFDSAVIFPKLMPVLVLAPVEAVPVRLIPKELTATVPDEAELVVLKVAPVPLTPVEKF